MIGKATLEDFPKAKRPINKPLCRIHMDSFSSSIKSFDGYNHAIAFVDAATEYTWLYGMKTKDDAIKAFRTCQHGTVTSQTYEPNITWWC